MKMRFAELQALSLNVLVCCIGTVATADLNTIRVDTATSTFRDGLNRTRIFHGLNYVNKKSPHYPAVNADEIAKLRSMGMTAVRLGVMMPGALLSSEILSRVIVVLFIAASHAQVSSQTGQPRTLPTWM